MSTKPNPVALATEQQRAILALFIAQLELPDCQGRCRPEFEAALASAEPLERIAHRLSTCLSGRPPSPTCTTLLRLVDGVSLPRELRAEAAAIHARLATADDSVAFGHHVRQLAGLIDDLPSRLQQEKDAVSDQLVSLAERLHALEAQLAESADIEAQASTETAALDRGVTGAVHEIEADLDCEPGHLGAVLHARLERIAEQVHTYREREQARLARIHAHNDQLQSRVRQLEGEVAQLQSSLKAQRARVVTDPLTGLHNRFAYDERLKHELALWQRYRAPFSLLLCDIDHFKQVNDLHGHQAGDEVLKAVADLLGSALRKSDFIARYGGEEFVVLLPGADAERAAAVGEKLRQRVAGATVDLEKARLGVTVSCGHATLAGESASAANKLFERADTALYWAKRGGRDRVCAG
jgi:diguanylate cyclase